MLVARRGAPAPLGHGVAPRAPERRAGEVCGARVGAPGDGVPLRRGYVGPAQGESREQVQAPTGPKREAFSLDFLKSASCSNHRRTLAGSSCQRRRGVGRASWRTVGADLGER